MGDTIDKITLKRAAKGDRKAFRKIYDTYSPFLWKVIYRTVNGDRDAASEIMNDTFFRIHKALHKFNFDFKFSTWIYQIAINTAKTYLTKRKQKWEHETELDGEIIGIENVDDYDRKELVSIILNSLSPEERFLLTAVTIESTTFDELADITGKSSGALRTKLSRLKGRIRKEFLDEF